MPTMIEKVAKVLFEDAKSCPWDSAKSYERYHYLNLAKAAIEAMREPTNSAMIDVILKE